MVSFPNHKTSGLFFATCRQKLDVLRPPSFPGQEIFNWACFELFWLKIQPSGNSAKAVPGGQHILGDPAHIGGVLLQALDDLGRGGRGGRYSGQAASGSCSRWTGRLAGAGSRRLRLLLLAGSRRQTAALRAATWNAHYYKYKMAMPPCSQKLEAKKL
jgi:hypothetical protein